ncbi:MAG: SOS response-associated peptidase [Bacteroidales bacterium]|nr:SOS response-associated peptidase [Bacteroidales bacterium]
MCFSISFIETSPQKYAEQYSILLNKKINTNQICSFNLYYFVSGFQFPVLPIVTYHSIVMSSWGLIPSWAKNANDIRSKTLNAMGETIFEKPSFRDAIKKQRCVLGVRGFYEWRFYNGKKYPYFIEHIEHKYLHLGCIYNESIDYQTGEKKHSFSIITTPANRLMEKIHNQKKRMPLILPEQHLYSWLDENTSKQHIENLIKPINEGILHAYTVAPVVSSIKENRNIPTVLEPYYYEELKNKQ